ncbi:putative plant UBX domain-containing protein 4 [Iris pallida]|nr:putative plant UBX domain-containing protein 4 [Iris pallida]
MLVQDPSRGNYDPDAIFDQARQQAVAYDYEAASSSRSFTGVGRLLSSETVPSASQQPEDIVYDISFWTNGFTVSDGPLRKFDDPENAPFLESIMKSECRKELEPANRRYTVHVNLVKKQERPFSFFKFGRILRDLMVAFQGVGRTLGCGSSSDSQDAAPAANAATARHSASPPTGLSVDGSLPSTSIQLRLADGTRMVARFNYQHTFGDIRAFIDSSRPGAAKTYQLQTVGFPPKQLTDATMTIEQAGLANSVVIQKQL